MFDVYINAFSMGSALENKARETVEVEDSGNAAYVSLR